MSAKAQPLTPMPSLDDARRLLQERGLIDVITPARLVASAQEMRLGLSEALDFLASVMSGGQGQGPFPETKAALKDAAK